MQGSRIQGFEWIYPIYSSTHSPIFCLCALPLLRSLSSTLLLRAHNPSKIRLTRCIMESYMYVQAGYIALKIIITVRDVHLIITGSPQGVLDYRSREPFALCPFVPYFYSSSTHSPIYRFSASVPLCLIFLCLCQNLHYCSCYSIDSDRISARDKINVPSPRVPYTGVVLKEERYGKKTTGACEMGHA